MALRLSATNEHLCLSQGIAVAIWICLQSSSEGLAHPTLDLLFHFLAPCRSLLYLKLDSVVMLRCVNATDVMPSNLPRVSRVFVTCASIVLVGASLPKWSYLFPWRHLCFLCFHLGCFAVSCLTASSRVFGVLWHTGGALNRWFYVESVSFLARFCLRCRFHAVLLLLLAQSVVFSGFCIRD